MSDSIESVVSSGPVVALVNPVMRFVLQSPFHSLVSDHMLLLAFHGATTGRSFLVPLSYHRLGGVPTAFSSANWVSSLAANPSLEMVLQGVRQTARAEIVDDPNQVADAMLKVLSAIGPDKASRFGLKVTGNLPPIHHVKKAMEGQKMVRLYAS